MTSKLKNALVLAVEDRKKTAEWFCELLGFELVDESEYVIASGNLELSLIQDGLEVDKTPTGLVHVALNAYDIDQALSDCKAKGLQIDCDNGKAYYNPKIWGTGTRYFNIATDFGVTVEICQRLDKTIGNKEKNIEGLEHVGIFASSVERSLDYYKSIGFEQLCPLVINEKPNMDIHCVMVGKGDLVLEIFSAENTTIQFPREWCGIDQMVVAGEPKGTFVGPDGERLQII